MEENTVELFDYLRVIWKRKILIIVVILVCIVVGVVLGAKNSGPKVPLVTYRADATVKIGKKVKIMLAKGSSPIIEYIEDPGLMVETVPLSFGLKVVENTEYHFDVERIGTLAMLKLVIKGPDKGVGRVLEEIVDRLIDKHRKKAKDSVAAYKDLMKKMEVDAEILEKEIYEMDKRIKDMKDKEGEYLLHIESSGAKEKGDMVVGDRSAFLNMLYLKTIDKESNLAGSRASLRDIQMQLTMQQITLGNLEEYKTELVGGIRNSTVELNSESKVHDTVVVGGIVGLIMSLLIAFFVEYIEESKSRRKGK
jgi:hypothetical protein